MKEISEEFDRALTTGGSLVIDCGFCNRTHFGNAIAFFEEGEYEDLCNKAHDEPDRYIEHDYDDVGWGMLDGKVGVIDCQCESLKRYEDFIWENRRLIATYLKAKTERMKKDANRDAEELADIEI